MHLRLHVFIVVLFILLVSLVETTTSQTVPRSTRGREFWVSFPDNQSPGNDQTNCNIYIFGRKPTSGFYRWGTNSIPFRLNDTNNYFFSETILLPQEVTQSELIENKGVYIEADDSINVYATSMADTNGLDATIVYPFSALAREYYVIARNEGAGQTQFLIVAPRDSTRVEITPTSMTEEGKMPNVPFNITLQRGQTYMVRSSGDLTGSRVRSIGTAFCNPIAVFTSSPLTTVGNCAPSNYLLEQLPPDAVLGTGYVIPKYPNTSGSIIRAMAIYPGTQIRLDGVNQGVPINTGQFREMSVDSFVYVNANKPFLLAHFTRGGACTPATPSVPTMTILPAVSQLQREASIYPPVGNLFQVTDSSTLNIVVRYDERGVTRINSLPVPIGDWRILPGNPLFGTYQRKVAADERIRIFHDMSGFSASIHGSINTQGFAMSAGGNFSQTIVGGLDTSGVFGETTFCRGAVANFRATADTTAESFRWEFGDGQIDTGRTVTHVYQNSGNYFLRLIIFRGAFCSFDTTRRLITVRANPAIKAGARPTLTLCKGQTAQLGLPELPGISYRWSPAIGLSDTTVGQPTVTATLDSVKYFVRGYDSFGCETQDSIVVKLYDQPIANAGPDTVSCGGN
ncbi:MAG: PKD domain-containing protein, partial [Candidatus Kapabacteria bacterium]|nr:PKD domain-containing protein [Candidatus Kapabacteria bacterium]